MEPNINMVYLVAGVLLLLQNSVHAQFTFTPTGLTIAENSGAGTNAATLTTRGQSGTVSYAFVSGSSTNFEINTANQKLLVISGATLNFEAGATLTVALTATDSAAPTDVKTASATVTLTNVNEVPVFSPATYTFSITNSAAAGTSIGTVTATDPDAGGLAASPYAISAAGNTDTTFEISNTAGSKGEIRVATGKTADKAFTLEVTAKDGAGTPLIATATVSIVIVSNGAPVYSQSFCALIVVLIIQAVEKYI